MHSKPHLRQNGSKGGPCHKGSRGALSAQLVKWTSPAHQHLDDDDHGRVWGRYPHRYGGCDDQVNIEKLCVSEVCLVAVQDEDGGKLDHGVEGHVLEHSKGGDQGTPDQVNRKSDWEGERYGPALPDQAWDAGDVRDSRGERCGHTRLLNYLNDLPDKMIVWSFHGRGGHSPLPRRGKHRHGPPSRHHNHWPHPRTWLPRSRAPWRRSHLWVMTNFPFLPGGPPRAGPSGQDSSVPKLQCEGVLGGWALGNAVGQLPRFDQWLQAFSLRPPHHHLQLPE